MSAILDLIPVIEPIVVGIMRTVRPDAMIRCHESIATVCEYVSYLPVS